MAQASGQRRLSSDTDPAAIRECQQEDVREALEKLGPSTVEVISEETMLPVFSVKARLAERPDWFREDRGRWQLT